MFGPFLRAIVLFQYEKTSGTQVIRALIVGVVLQDSFSTLDPNLGDASRTVCITSGVIHCGCKQGALVIVRVAFGRLVKVFECLLNVPLVIMGARQVMVCPAIGGIELKCFPEITFGFGKSCTCRMCVTSGQKTFRVIRCELHRLIRGLVGKTTPLLVFRKEIRIERTLFGQVNPCSNETGIEFDRFLKHFHREFPVTVATGNRITPTAQKVLVSLWILRRRIGQLLDTKPTLQCLENTCGDVVLNSEDIIELSIVGFLPQVRVCCDFDQLCRNTNAITGLADTALEYVSDLQLLRDSLEINILVLDRE